MAREGKHSHDPGAIADRLSQGPKPSYLPDAIYGAIDGTIATALTFFLIGSSKSRWSVQS